MVLLQVPAAKTLSTGAANRPAVAGFQQTTTDAETQAIKLSLQDCLACSGCVTTAETMLLQQQSSEELLAQLKQPHINVVASVSPQSIASLAAAYDLPVHTVRITCLISLLQNGGDTSCCSSPYRHNCHYSRSRILWITLHSSAWTPTPQPYRFYAVMKAISTPIVPYV